MEPVTVTCSGECTVTHVVTLDFQPFQLSTAEAGEIGGAILLIWAVGFAFRQVIKVLKNSDGESTTEREL